MLLALMLMHLLQIPMVAMLATQLDRHREYGKLCGFNGNSSGAAPDRSTFSKFLTRAEPKTVEGVFWELRRQALKMSLYGRGRRVVGAVDSTFIHAYSRRKRKAGVSDRRARVGKVERTTYALGWRIHTVATEERLPLCYVVRSANVNDRVPAPKLVCRAVSLLENAGSAMRVLLADAQYYWAEFFSLLEGFGVKPVIPAPPQVKEPLIRLRIKRGFVLE